MIEPDLYEREKLRSQIEERICSAFHREMKDVPEEEFQYMAVCCAMRLLQTGQHSLRAATLKRELLQ